MVYPTPTAKPKETFMLFAFPTGVQGNVVSKGVNELIIPNYKQTWGNIRKIAEAPEVTRHMTFKSQEYMAPRLTRRGGSMSASRFWHSQAAFADSRRRDFRIERRTTMIDPFGRAITYLRVSVTDRCDFRCVYCMAEDMTFLPKAELLTLGGARPALQRLRPAGRAQAPAHRRRAAGAPQHHEPVPRRSSRHLDSGALDELTLTTNGSQLARYAGELAACGVRRINVSLDTLDPEKFTAITRWGHLDKVLAGIGAAKARGPPDQDQRRRAQGRQRGRVRPS